LKLDGYKLYHSNGKYLGEVMLDEDGFYKYWPDMSLLGYWTEESLLEVAKVLQTKNASWKKELGEYFKND